MKRTSKSVLISGCIFFGLFYACTKDNSSANSSDNETQTATDNLLAESIANDVTTVSAQSEDNGTSGSYGTSSVNLLLSPCATVIIDYTSTPNRLTIDYGNTNCLCLDGKYRRGKILVAYTGFYRDSASVHTIGFNNYYVNDYKVEGTQTVVNKGHNAAGNLVFSVKTNGSLIDTAGRTLTFKSDRMREWIAGEATDGLNQWQDDVYSITGTASGTDFSGEAYTAEIKSPLVFSLSCQWIEAGKFDFKPQGELTRTIDFGSGNCDNKASVSIAGFTINIIME